jgi:hypothetical protein
MGLYGAIAMTAGELNKDGINGYYYTMAGMLIIMFVLNRKSRKRK